MKKFTALILTAILLCLCCGCGAEPAQSQEAVIRYEGSAAYYSYEGAELKMELNFAEPVPAWKEIALQKGGKTVLSFTLGQAVSLVEISAYELEENVDYTVLVDGVTQRHGKTSVAQPGYIPDPEVPTIPTEIQGETEPTTQTTEDKFGFSKPSIGFDEQTETIGSFADRDSTTPQSGGELPSEAFSPDREEDDSSLAQQFNPNPDRNVTVFCLEGRTTVFHQVRDAS